MNKDYWLRFGSGNPANNTGLSPTFTVFSGSTGAVISPSPLINEIPVGGGIYHFAYGPTIPIVFTVDGGPALSSADRYIVGVLDPIQAVDQKVGTLDDSFGATNVDPSTLIGYAKRSQEWLEGNADFQKATGTWNVYSRGSSTLLAVKQLANNTTEATKD